MSEENKGNTLSKHVVGVIEGHEATQAAAQDLRTHGFDGQTIFRHDAITREVDPKGEHDGIVGKIVKGVQDHLSEERNYLAQYEEEARNGKDVIAVPADGDEKVHEVAAILADHGARNIRYFGLLAVKDLSPESNPSTRSAESPEAKNWSNV